MIVTKADTLIANTKNDGRREVRFISLQVFFVWGTFTLLNLIVLTTNPRIPNDLYYILKCKGTELLKIQSNKHCEVLVSCSEEKIQKDKKDSESFP